MSIASVYGVAATRDHGEWIAAEVAPEEALEALTEALRDEHQTCEAIATLRATIDRLEAERDELRDRIEEARAELDAELLSRGR